MGSPVLTERLAKPRFRSGGGGFSALPIGLSFKGGVHGVAGEVIETATSSFLDGAGAGVTSLGSGGRAEGLWRLTAGRPLLCFVGGHRLMRVFSSARKVKASERKAVVARVWSHDCELDPLRPARVWA